MRFVDRSISLVIINRRQLAISACVDRLRACGGARIYAGYQASYSTWRRAAAAAINLVLIKPLAAADTQDLLATDHASADRQTHRQHTVHQPTLLARHSSTASLLYCATHRGLRILLFSAYTQGDSNVISFRIYASWFRRHLVGKTLKMLVTVTALKYALLVGLS